MWGGFYDRTIKELRETKKIIFISLAYEIQKCEKIQREAHDETPDFIVTQNNKYTP
jgi:5-formyltetrahydrofolate cyclo-ligase